MFTILSVFVDVTDEVHAIEESAGIAIASSAQPTQPFHLYVATSGRDEYQAGIRVADSLIAALNEVRARLLAKAVREADDSNRVEL